MKQTNERVKERAMNCCGRWNLPGSALDEARACAMADKMYMSPSLTRQLSSVKTSSDVCRNQNPFGVIERCLIQPYVIGDGPITSQPQLNGIRHRSHPTQVRVGL